MVINVMVIPSPNSETLFVYSFIYVSPGYHGTHYVYQAGSELTKVSLPLLPKRWH